MVYNCQSILNAPNNGMENIAIDSKRKTLVRKKMYVGLELGALQSDQKAPVEWRRSTCGLVFDTKMDFCIKVHLVLDGQKASSILKNLYMLL